MSVLCRTAALRSAVLVRRGAQPTLARWALTSVMTSVCIWAAVAALAGSAATTAAGVSSAVQASARTRRVRVGLELMVCPRGWARRVARSGPQAAPGRGRRPATMPRRAGRRTADG